MHLKASLAVCGWCLEALYALNLELRYSYVYCIPWLTYRNLQWGADKNKTLWDDFNFPIMNSPFICSNNTAAPIVQLSISRLIRYSGAFDSFKDFFITVLVLTMELFKHRLLIVKLGHHVKSFIVAIMTWFTVTVYL